MEVKNELADKAKLDPIVEYYKNWSSDVAPIMMSFDISEYPGKLESEDQKKMAYLRQKYKKLSK
jgi:lysyl-tRNA synthetase class I